MLRIDIDTSNDALRGDGFEVEVSRILQQVSREVASCVRTGLGIDSARILAVNGNTVGNWEYGPLTGKGSLQEIEEYGKRLAPTVSLKLERIVWSSQWHAIVETDHNDYPHWQYAEGETLLEAWRKLKVFLDGGPQPHGSVVVKASDFFRKAT